MFDALLQGQSAVRRISLQSSVGSFDTIGAAVNSDHGNELPRGQRVTSDRISLYALVAANAAIRDSCLDLAAEDRRRIGVAIGTSLGGTITQEAAYEEMFCNRASRLSPFTLVKVMYNGPSAQIALAHLLDGPSLTYTTTCSSSTVSIGEAMRHIRHGYADVMIAGGAEALFAYVAIKAWEALKVLAPERQDNPAATCRPFSKDRTGTVLGDGAAIVILEDWVRATKRGARIYAELAGYGICNDSSHMTQPSVASQAHAMQLAIDDARLTPDAIDYVNAHGTGTPLNDVAETLALKQVFRKRAHGIPVSSTKSMHGHLVGAAGALELVVSILALQRQIVPPTAHLDIPDPQCDLDYVPHKGRSVRVRAAMSNSFAVGGTTGALVVREGKI